MRSLFTKMYVHPSCSHHIVRDCMVDWTHCLCRRQPSPHHSSLLPSLFPLLFIFSPLSPFFLPLFNHPRFVYYFCCSLPHFDIWDNISISPLSPFYLSFSFFFSPIILGKIFPFLLFLCLMCSSEHLLLSFLGLIQISPSLSLF